jgi:fused signal recognition particle receptor
MALWTKIRDGLARTRDALGAQIGAALGLKGSVDAATLELLEEALLSADVGPATSARLIERAQALMGRERGLELRQALEACAAQILGPPVAFAPGDETPWVALVVGVNGVGKTTLTGKLAARSRATGSPPYWWRPTPSRRGGRAAPSVGGAGVESRRAARNPALIPGRWRTTA